MTRTAGIPFASLFGTADTINQALPDTFSRLQALDVSIAGRDVESFDLPFGKLKIPMITTGVPFRLALTRAAITADLEPAAGAWQFDLMLGEFELELDGLTAADYVC